jgi:hypothetical protein
VIESPGIFGEGDAFWVNGKQIAHFREEDVLELRLTKSVIQALRARLKSDPRVELRPTSSDWVKVRFGASADVPRVLELAKQAATAHRPPPGVTAKSPPIGPDLERRRRFH